MKFKKTVLLTGIRAELLAALNVADGVWADFGEKLIVTCVGDGQHSTTSLHYAGSAADLRTRYFPPAVRQQVRDALKDSLPDDYDVVLEATHIHLEFQPRRPRN